jgi:adenine-specific DNA-methyltransferase
MKKLALRTPDLSEHNYAALAKLFPNAVTEAVDENGKLVRAIDADVLRQEINAHVVSGKEERYQFTWPDKKKSILLASAPVEATLRPCREESVDFDNTENLYIEGDNLDVLKLLRETYLNRVKMIYIDPPYNTGSDFIYEDDFSEDTGVFLTRDHQYDEDGNRMVRNLDSNGRFHTDWLNMMYPRLRIAKDLVRDDGVIFISIDDGEAENLKKICNEIFGENNFVAQIIWQKKYSVSNDDPGIAPMHDYILSYRKTAAFTRNLLTRSDKQSARYTNPDNDPRGVWTSSEYVSSKTKEERPTLWYSIKHPQTGEDVWPDENAVWRYSQEKHHEMVTENRLYWGTDLSYKKPRLKRFLSELKDGVVPSTWWPFVDVGHNDEASKETASLLGKKVFSTPKPIRLLHRMLTLGTNINEGDIILDFFSGSATTAHAVMQLNAEDGGKRKFIMVQIPEICDEGTEAAKAGYKNICEIGKERIRRAGAKIKADSPTTTQDLDTGFRVLKLAGSNMKNVRYSPDEYINQNLDLNGFIDNIEPDRTPEDLLFQVMLDLGLSLSSPIEQLEIGNVAVFAVDGNKLLACFERVTEEIVIEIAKRKPYYAVFRDRSFANDATLVNFEQVFLAHSPTTIRKVL